MRQGNVSNKKIGRSEDWGERIAEQERSGVSVKQFCAEQGCTEQSFYRWRKRLRKQIPLRFALVETGGGASAPASEMPLELVLGSGERLRIGSGVDPIALRRVLEALRG